MPQLPCLVRVRSRKAMENLIPGYSLSVLETIDSTNLECRKMAENGAADGTIIQALSQSMGRGRRGRKWQSPEGNLYFSMVLKPDCTATRGLGLSFVAAVAMCDALGSIMPPMTEVLLKWPNDILINRRKVCGFLLESSSDEKGYLKWVIVGCGVNVQTFPEDVAYPATSMKFEGSSRVPLREVLLLFVRHFKRWRDVWEEEGFSPIRTAWLGRAIGLGETITARLPDASHIGKFVDISEDGSLLMETVDGKKLTITSGDIFPEEKS